MHVVPPGGDVDWPAEEGTIGVVGVAPWATHDFLGKLYELVPARKDWEFPRVIVDANAKIPSRGRHLDLGERDPSPFIAGTIAELARQGATVAVVPCNTAHLLYERWGADLPIHTPHIWRASIGACASDRVAALGSAALAHRRAYETLLEARGATVVDTSDLQDTVSGLIENAKLHGGRRHSDRMAFATLLDSIRVRGAGSVILGCTELPMLIDGDLDDLQVVDSSRELARAALREAGVRTID